LYTALTGRMIYRRCSP